MTLNPILFITVSDADFFPGTLAAVNSVLQYHPGADVAVISSGKFNRPLTPRQVDLLRAGGVRVFGHEHFDGPGRTLGAWQLKTYAVNDLSVGRDIVVLFDSDLIFCGPVDDVIEQCVADGKIRGGQDAHKVYDTSYAVYGIPAGSRDERHISTSCCFVPVSPRNRAVLARWTDCTNKAIYGPQAERRYPGYGDQGVLNAVLFADSLANGKNVEPMPNELWSQHSRFATDVIEFDGDRLINRSAGGSPQRTLHSVTTDKFWTAAHSARRRADGQNQRWSYAAFLNHLFLGPLTDWGGCAADAIVPGHLYCDLLFYHQLIRELRANFSERWQAAWGPPWKLADQCMRTCGVERLMPLDGLGSMSRYIELARSVPDGGTIVEVGSYQGGSVLTLAAALVHKQLNIWSVESFMGDGDGRFDDVKLPTLDRYLANVKGLPFLNVNTMQLPSVLAARQFADSSIDMVFIDGCHSVEAVRADIVAWLPKIRAGGVIAGDDIGWRSVREAVAAALPGFEEQNGIWWESVGG